MTLFSEKVFISNRCISGLMSNLIKKSWTVSIAQPLHSLCAASVQSLGSLWAKSPLLVTALHFVEIIEKMVAGKKGSIDEVFSRRPKKLKL